MLQACSRTVFPELLEIFGPEAVIKFMDIFGGLTVKVPSRTFLEQATRDVDIFHTMATAQDKTAAKEFLAVKYDMEPGYVLQCYDRVKDIRVRYHLDG